MIVLFSLLVGTVLTYWLYWRLANRRLLDLASKFPGPTAYPLIGNSLMFLAQPKELLNIIAQVVLGFGDCCRVWIGPDLNIAVKNPADVRMLLTSNKVNNKGPLYNFMLPFIGPGILAGGPTWRNHRKIATPSYNKKSVKVFSEIFNREAVLLANELLKKPKGETFDIYHDVVQTTTCVVCQTLMGLSRDEYKDVRNINEIVVKTQSFYDLIFKQMTHWWLHIPGMLWLTGTRKQKDDFVKLIDEFTTDIVNRRRKALEKGSVPEDAMGIVDRFILSGEMTQEQIKHETMSLFTTSQEAAAKIASGVLMIIGQLPEWQKRVYDEIMEVVGTGPVTENHLKELLYLDMVYKETLRYFSIAGFIQRTVDEEIAISDGLRTIPAGTSLIIPIHLIHRDPKNWEDPNRILPDRFLPENVKKRDPNAFVPFSLGPMDCLGRVYATALIKTLVVHIVRKIHLESSEPVCDLDLQIAISVKPVNGYNVNVRPRANGYHKSNGYSH